MGVRPEIVSPTQEKFFSADLKTIESFVSDKRLKLGTGEKVLIVCQRKNGNQCQVCLFLQRKKIAGN